VGALDGLGQPMKREKVKREQREEKKKKWEHRFYSCLQFLEKMIKKLKKCKTN
jgi:hypothetical protein